MALDPPVTDSRRASQLRDALRRSAPMLAPDWAGLDEEGDFGRALVEIAARLAEHSTARLDRSALRDKLAFLEALDVATPAPQSATAPIVFTLAEKRETPVSAPARVQLTATPDEEDGEDLTFETQEAIDLSPARLAALIVTDPATDRIERAPGFVTGGLEGDTPATRYLLLSAVETRADALQLVQAVGIAPGDLLRLGGVAYRVKALDGSIVQLRDRLTGPSPAGAAVEKLIALEAFELRNLQEHAVYIGHKELLKLDGPAEISLVFDPPTLPSRLAALDVEYRIWGTLDGAADPDWQELELVGAGPAGLMLAKSAKYSVDELELPAGKSRWLRLRLRTPIAGACGPATGALSVQLKVRSTAPPPGETEGSGTIAAAFYNSQPLPTSTAFFPFGPEPQRFDIFSLSAPEALSKKGARVTLDFKLDDASLRSMAYDPAAPDHVYGISVNGRLQSIRFDQPASAIWRPLGLATADGAAPGEGSVRLDPGATPHVLRVGTTLDIVFVRGKDEAIRVARVATTDGNVAVAEWQSLPHPAGKPFAAFCLIPAPAVDLGQAGGLARFRRLPPTRPLAYLLAADSVGFYSQAIGFGGVPAGAWTQLQSMLAPGEKAALALAGGDSDEAVVAAIDAAGALHRGDLDLAGGRIDWTALNSKGAKAATTVQPLAYLAEKALVVVAAREAGDASPSPLIVVGRDPPVGDLDLDLGEVGSLALMPAPDAGDAPLILATGERGVLIWSDGESEIADLPAEADPKDLRALLLPPMESPKLLLAVGSELVLEGSASSGGAPVSLEFSDLLHREPDSPVPSHTLTSMEKGRRIDPLDATWLPFEGRLVQPALRTDGIAYLLLEDMQTTLSGTRSDDRQLQLNAADLVTREDDILVIGGKSYAVTAKTDDLVDLDADLPAGPSLDYVIYRPTGLPATKFLKADRKRFVKPAKSPTTAPLKFLFAGSIAPRTQYIVDAHDDWLLLRKAWTTLPPGTTAQATLFTLSGLAFDAQIRLPRDSDNPDLSWEYFDGDGWQRLDKWGLIDRTGNFARTGTVTFIVPPTLAQTEIAGKEDYWLRVRLIGGDYGRPTYDIVSQPPIQQAPPKPVKSTTSITIDRSRLNPPEVISVEASYALDEAVPPDRVVADNNLAAIDQTQAALARGAVFGLFEGIAQHVADTDGGTRALYLGFGRAPGVAVLNIYADAVDRNHPPGELIAEALTAGGWRKIGDADETAALTAPGMLRLFLTPPPEQLPLFGMDGWWLRLRPKRDAARWAPKLRGFFVNAVMAEHAKSISQEILGSSLGDPKQSYQLAQRPVLPLTLELRVREALSEEERKAVEKSAGKDAIKDDDPNLPGEWVLWRQVGTFVDQDGDARVYRLDPATGEVRFGDGRCGKIPPAGRDSIRAFSYQQGGGSAGNVAARAIDSLSSAIESVELAINPVDAAGGADPPRAERLAASAPGFLRHAGRALAPADIEALAVESAPDVVRARCLAGKGCGIELAVAIGGTGARCPVPTRARRDGIARNIAAAGWGALAPGAVKVHPPRYIPVRVAVEALAKSAAAVAGVARAVGDRLADFLHPIEGGPNGDGWAFGRRPWPSDLQRAIAEIDGLDRVIGIDIAAKEQGQSLDAIPPAGLICVEAADLAIVVRPPEDGR